MVDIVYGLLKFVTGFPCLVLDLKSAKKPSEEETTFSAREVQLDSIRHSHKTLLCQQS